jgi:cytochrome P450
MNVNAGSDTISTTLRAIFYYLLKHPSTLERIRSELDTAVAEGKISPVFVTWAESNSLPYLHSVILEALRIHPPISLSLERVVPSGGLQLPNGMYIPPGTVVGINPWVLHRDERIFGADASSWRPERWLDQDIEVVKTMERNLLSFGAGKRSCLGKNIAMLELHKIVSALLLRYDFQMVNPGMEWKLKNSWVISQKGLDMFVFRRQPKGESYQVTMGS